MKITSPLHLVPGTAIDEQIDNLMTALPACAEFLRSCM
jgi:hypothetical protein